MTFTAAKTDRTPRSLLTSTLRFPGTEASPASGFAAVHPSTGTWANNVPVIITLLCRYRAVLRTVRDRSRGTTVADLRDFIFILARSLYNLHFEQNESCCGVGSVQRFLVHSWKETDTKPRGSARTLRMGVSNRANWPQAEHNQDWRSGSRRGDVPCREHLYLDVSVDH